MTRSASGEYGTARDGNDERIGALPVREGKRILGVFTTADGLDALLGLLESPPR